MKLKLKISDDETRRVWKAALAAKKEVESWPAWKRGDDYAPVPKDAAKPEQVSSGSGPDPDKGSI